VALKCQLEIFLAHAFSFLPFVSEVPTEPVQGNYEAIEDMLIIQAKQAKVTFTTQGCS